MQTHPVPELDTINYVMPFVVPLVVITLMSLLKEPSRQKLNAIIIGVAAGVYFNGGLGIWEIPFTLIITYCGYRGLTHYYFLGIAWLLHTAWDVVHHLTGNPMLSMMPSSSFECAIIDVLLATWFFLGAPSVFHLAKRRLIKNQYQ